MAEEALPELAPAPEGLDGGEKEAPSTSSAPSPSSSSPIPSFDFRSAILERLQQRNAACRQFEPVFASYNSMVDEVLKLRHRRVSRTESAGPSSSAVSDAQLEALRAELSDVYKKKSVNDQHLLEATRALDELRKRLDTVTKEHDDVLSMQTKLYARIAHLEVKLHTAEEDRTSARDECLALQLNQAALAEKVQNYEIERQQLLARINQLQEQQINFFNSEMEQQQKRQNDLLRAQIEAAIADTSDNGVPDLIPLGGEEAETVGDVLPTACCTKFEANEGEVTSLAWLGTDIFATGGSDKIIRVFRVNPRGQVEKTSSLVGCNQTVTRIDWDVTRRSVLASSNDHMARLWSLDTGRLLTTLSGHSDKISSARFLKDYQVVTGSYDRTLKIFDVRGNKSLRTFFPGSIVLDVCASGSSFISGHHDKKARVYDGRCAEPVKTIEFAGKVTSVDIAYDGRSFLCSTRDDVLSMVDMRSFAIIHIYGAEAYRNSSDLSRSILSPCQEYVAAGSTEGSIFVWRTGSTKLETRLSKKGHEVSALALAWNPSGRGLLSADKQKHVCLWF